VSEIFQDTATWERSDFAERLWIRQNFKAQVDVLDVLTKLLQVDPWLIQSDSSLLDSKGYVIRPHLELFAAILRQDE